MIVFDQDTKNKLLELYRTRKIYLEGNLPKLVDAQDDTEFAGMANPEKRPDDTSGELKVDCGASTTITESLFNMTNVEPRVVTIQLAMSDATIKSTHVGMKTLCL